MLYYSFQVEKKKKGERSQIKPHNMSFDDREIQTPVRRSDRIWFWWEPNNHGPFYRLTCPTLEKPKIRYHPLVYNIEKISPKSHIFFSRRQILLLHHLMMMIQWFNDSSFPVTALHNPVACLLVSSCSFSIFSFPFWYPPALHHHKQHQHHVCQSSSSHASFLPFLLFIFSSVISYPLTLIVSSV